MFENPSAKPYQHLPNFSTIRYPNNSEYNGQVVDGKKHGKGRLMTSVLDFFDGEWENDELNGKGICQMPNGDRYEGSFQQGKFNGIGTIFYSNKTWYKGNFVNGKKEGQGTETSASGVTYTGQFENDKPCGKGVQIKGEYSYDGSFNDGVKEGHGKEFYKESSYTGSFWKGQKHGKGLWTHSNGGSYKGDWYLGQKHGYGVETTVESDKEKEGEKRKVKDIYDGEFREGYRDGFGRISVPETGNFHHGYWHRGVMNGRFLFYNGAEKTYFVQEYDYGKEVGQPQPRTRPTPDLDGYRSVIGDSVIKGEKVHDDDLDPRKIIEDCGNLGDFIDLEYDQVEWPRMSDRIDTASVHFFPQDKIAERIEYSKYSNYQLLTVLLTLAEYPTQLMRLFNPLYSAELGYFIVKFFTNGEWNQVLIDDYLPFIKEQNKPLSSTLGSKHYVGLHLLEKAWAKITKSYFSCYTNPFEPEFVIEVLTGISPQYLSFSEKDRNNSWDMLTSDKSKHIKMKFVVPKPEFAQSMNLPPKYFYIVLDHLSGGGDYPDLIRLKSIDKSRVLEGKWNDMSAWPAKLLKRAKISNVEELNAEDGIFWIESDKLFELFKYGLFCPIQEGYNHYSFLRKGNLDNFTSHHEMRFFEFDVPYKTVLNLVVTQLLTNKDDNYSAIRLILTKKIDSLQYEYVFGKGQFNLMSMHRTLVLDGGIYDLCVHMEYPKDVPRKSPIDINVVLYTPAPMRMRPNIGNIPQFLNKAYKSCAEKFGEATDMTKYPNGNKKLQFYELYRGEDGVFVQHFENKSDNIRWKYSANFTLTNMRIVGLPEHRQQVEITVEPKRNHTLLIMQTGGKSYEFLGGQGSVNLEIVQRHALKPS